VKWREWATTDIHQLAAKWAGSSYPAAGIECEKAGLVVIDEDTLDEFQRLAADRGETIPDTYAVRTGRPGGGRQSYFAADGHGIRSTTALKRLGYDIDVKAAGGFVVAAGSLHPSGATYQVERDADVVPVMNWLVELLNGTSETVAPPFELPDQIAIGTRDDTLWRYACSLRGKGVKVTDAVRAMQEAWKRCDQPAADPYPWEDALEKIDRAWGYDYTPTPVPPTTTIREGFHDLDASAPRRHRPDADRYRPLSRSSSISGRPPPPGREGSRLGAHGFRRRGPLWHTDLCLERDHAPDPRDAGRGSRAGVVRRRSRWPRGRARSLVDSCHDLGRAMDGSDIDTRERAGYRPH
jgi:hypothetical protein